MLPRVVRAVGVPNRPDGQSLHTSLADEGGERGQQAAGFCAARLSEGGRFYLGLPQ